MLTILMATHNGETTLPTVLDSYRNILPPLGGWKLVVVDNSSTDRTAEIINRYRDRLPLSIIRTELRGKNVSLNIGLKEIEGDLVVLTDDDVVPQADWLVGLRKTADGNTDFDIFGGGIYAIWPENLPEWIPRIVNLGATYGITAKNNVSGPVPASQIWGANMAIRSFIFGNGYRFNEKVGPQAGQYIMGSETDFTCKLEKAGHKSWFDAENAVGHIIRPNQVTHDWIISRAFRLGRHMYHQEKSMIQSSTPMLFGVPRWKYRRLLGEYSRFIRSYLTRDTDKKFSAEWEISLLRGYLQEGSKNK